MTTINEKNEKAIWFKKIEKTLVWIASITIIFGVTILSIKSTIKNPNDWWYLIVAYLFAFMAICGILSVVASNNKAPIKLLFLSLIATVFKLLYPTIQLLSGAANVNSTVFFGQTWSLVALTFQVWLWIRWNKRSETNRFFTKYFNKDQNIIFFIFITILFLIGLIISIFVFNNDLIWALIDVIGGISYALGNWLMVFGNIYCFAFFIISDITWVFWTISDFLYTDSIIMILITICTLIEVLTYLCLAVTGFLSWKNDNKVKQLSYLPLPNNLNIETSINPNYNKKSDQIIIKLQNDEEILIANNEVINNNKNNEQLILNDQLNQTEIENKYD